jgi:colicin import membrane protein
MNYYSYRLSFIFAVMLHVALVFSLLIKFTSSRPVRLSSSSAFINAVAISERDFNKQMSKSVRKQQREPKVTKTIPPKQTIKKQPAISSATLQKKLLAEQTKEIAALKKERQVYQKKVAKEQQQRQQQMQTILQNQIMAEQKQLEDAKAQAIHAQFQGEVDENKARVLQAISSQWIVPDGVDENATCRLLIDVGPGGVVLDVKLISSSGNPVLDRSARTAVLKASPLPVPEDPRLFNEFRTIKLTVRPEGIVGG